MKDSEVYRKIKPVDLAPILPALVRVSFFRSGQTGKYAADVATKLPRELREFVAQLGLGGLTARAILRRLSPRQSIPPHVDDWMPKAHNWSRFQVPLTSHPDIRMRWPDDGIDVHLEPGYLYEVRFDRTHEVVHNADCERIHLQIDQVDATI